MTKENQMDDLMQMAREAGIARWHKDLKKWVFEPGLEKFARLVAKKAVEAAKAEEREACVRAADDQWVKDPHISGGDAIRKRR